MNELNAFCYIIAEEFDRKNSEDAKEEQFVELDNGKEKESYYLEHIERLISE